MSRAETSRAPTRSVVTFDGTALSRHELLRSPVSGQACVHWRVRIVQRLTPRTQLVHELSSPEPFELVWNGASPPALTSGGDGADGERGRGGTRIRLDPQAARIHATPVLHREGTPGALAAAHAFGFDGPISVEEVLIRQGEELSAEGILDDPTLVEGPFRATTHALELLDATVRLEARGLGPGVLLPWALGTAAALLGGVGLATYAAWRYHLIHLPAGAHAPRLFSPAAKVKPPEYPQPRWR